MLNITSFAQMRNILGSVKLSKSIETVKIDFKIHKHEIKQAKELVIDFINCQYFRDVQIVLWHLLDANISTIPNC